MYIWKSTKGKYTSRAIGMLLFACTWSGLSSAQTASTNLAGDYGFKVYRVESGLYPFVHIFLRTFQPDMTFLPSLNELNVGLMVGGKIYDVAKRQYFIRTVEQYQVATRTVIVVDGSGSMKNEPAANVLRAASRFIDNQRNIDQTAIIASDESVDGYRIVSQFERDKVTLANRLADVTFTAQTTSIFDAVAEGMKMCASSGAGGLGSSDAEYFASCSIILFSDGDDNSSALKRDDLMARINSLETPIPIYSLAYTNSDPEFLKNLQAFSKNSFGKYYAPTEANIDMGQNVEQISSIIKNDYVVVFRAYKPIDGEEHGLKVGVEYPTHSGKMRYESGDFEAIQAPPVDRVRNMQIRLNEALAELPDHDPYLTPAVSVSQ